MEEEDQETFNRWHNDPNNWILGLFYYNKSDKRVFLPKKVPYLGVTVNFANPKSYLPLGLLLAIPIVILVLVEINA